jgi:hypothetical protein
MDRKRDLRDESEVAEAVEKMANPCPIFGFRIQICSSNSIFFRRYIRQILNSCRQKFSTKAGLLAYSKGET